VIFCVLCVKFCLEDEIRAQISEQATLVLRATMKLILASSSPRRAEVLRDAGIEFEVRPTAIDETLRSGESASGYVRRLAIEKARAAVEAAAEPADFAVIGADTVVVDRDEIMLKPVSPDDARRMLRRLGGSVHEVHTGVAVIRMPERAERVIEEVTRVHFAKLSDAEIEAYVATGEPFDKAGAYGIQGIGGRYVTRVEGCYFNVMGMPLARLWAMLQNPELETMRRAHHADQA
jgi:septum formation protein